MIKERVDKDYASMLRTSLTSISKVNKTDVETLRMAFGGFSAVAKASAEQLQELPGFGQVKVKNIKNVFDKPFRNIPNKAKRIIPSIDDAIEDEPIFNQTDNIIDEPSSGRPRRQSPTWDIEKDLSPEPGGSSHLRPSARPESPPWDIELDLN